MIQLVTDLGRRVRSRFMHPQGAYDTKRDSLINFLTRGLLALEGVAIWGND